MNNQKSWSLGSFEVAKSVGTNSGSTFKLHIGKIMPLIAFGKPKTKAVPVSKSCFVNDVKCKPSVATRVTTANYMTVPVSKTVKFWRGVSHGSKLVVSVANNSIDQLTVTDQK